MNWTREEEDALVEKNYNSLVALARQNGEDIGHRTARSIAFGMALSTLHAREHNAFLADYIKSCRPPTRIILTPEEAAKWTEKNY